MKKKAKTAQKGICKLTGIYGEFVKSHILPRALTVLSNCGEKITEAALSSRPKRRPATWYDNQLAVQEGEKILEEIDTPAIQILRKHQLIWSAFNCDEPFLSEELYSIDEYFSLREINAGAANELRLFFLSIAWRAAVSVERQLLCPI